MQRLEVVIKDKSNTLEDNQKKFMDYQQQITELNGKMDKMHEERKQ